jgi:hypothetical protein
MPQTAKLNALPRRKVDFIEVMECALVPTLPAGPDWTFEVKFDGYRAIGVRGGDTIVYSRNHKNFNKRFPQIAEALGELPADTVVDGEIVALDESGRPDFQHFTAEASRIQYFVFDLLILERVKAGLRNARAKGKRLGRPRKILDTKRVAARRALGVAWKRIAAEMGVGVGTIIGSPWRVPKLGKRILEPPQVCELADLFRSG